MAGGLIIFLLVTAIVQVTSGQQVYLSLGSTIITTNNTEILITDIGEHHYYYYYYYHYGRPSLTCHTDLTACCRNSDTGGQGGLGEWYYPNGSKVQNNTNSMAAGEGFYRWKDDPQSIRLIRRQLLNPLEPTGSYCCVIPTTGGEMTFCANIVVCPSLPLTNGSISYNDPTLDVGSVATHSCDTGYTLNGESIRTCQSNGTWSGSAATCEDQAVVQLQFGPTSHCIDWSQQKASIVSGYLREAIHQVILSSSEGSPLVSIDEGVFTCRTSQKHTTFRTTITIKKSKDGNIAVQAAADLQKWVESGPVVRVEWYMVDVSLSCPVAISSLTEQECIDDQCVEGCVTVCRARG